MITARWVSITEQSRFIIENVTAFYGNIRASFPAIERFLPTAEQGVALAALESGRWKIESGTFTVHDGPGPSDPLGLIREIRVSDWVTADVELTLTGRKALGRWLEQA